MRDGGVLEFFEPRGRHDAPPATLLGVERISEAGPSNDRRHGKRPLLPSWVVVEPMRTLTVLQAKPGAFPSLEAA